MKQITKELGQAFKALHKAKFTHVSNSDCMMKKSHTYVLMTIKGLGGGVTATELAKKMDITMGAITHHIQELENLGYIEREQDYEDKRVSLISLTDVGQEVLESFEKIHLKHMQSIVEYLGQSDSEKLVEIINKLSRFNKQN